MINVLLSYIPFITTLGQAANGSCQKNFLGLPPWYKYMEGAASCDPRLTHINDIWLILLAVIEILLRIAVIAAIIYVVIGGFKFVTSRANPDKVNAAKNTVIDGMVGLVISIVAIAVISFIGGRFN